MTSPLESGTRSGDPTAGFAEKPAVSPAYPRWWMSGDPRQQFIWKNQFAGASARQACTADGETNSKLTKQFSGEGFWKAGWLTKPRTVQKQMTSIGNPVTAQGEFLMLSASLVVVGGDAADKEIRLQLPAIVGRGRETQVTVQHSLVSRQHCELLERNGRLFVRDLGSLNGTYVNNFRIQTEEPLLPGQLLTLGNITFRAKYELAGAPANPEPTPAVDANHKAANHKSDRPRAVRTAPVPAQSPARTAPARAPIAPQRPAVSPAITVGVPEAIPASPMSATVAASLVTKVPGTNPATNPATLTAANPSPASVSALQNPLHSAPPHEPQRHEPERHEPQRLAANSDLHDVLDELASIADPEHSILISALQDLPGTGPAVSFIGGLQIPGQSGSPDSDTGEIEVASVLGEPVAKVDPDDSALGSFLRRLPR